MTERTIGQLAHDAGVGVETIRYYQRIGLIPKPARTFNGWHHYPERTLQLLRCVRQGRQLGFSLRELNRLLGPSRTGTPLACSAFRAAVAAKIVELDAAIARMAAHRAQLCELAETCDGDEPQGACPAVERLA